MGEQVVDAVPWHGGVLLGHPCAISLLLLSDQILGIFLAFQLQTHRTTLNVVVVLWPNPFEFVT